jgi:hypothetical protein
MAITYDRSSAFNNGSGATTITGTATTNGPNRLVVLDVTYNSATALGTAPTIGGVAMTFKQGVTNGTSRHETWALYSAGTLTASAVVVTLPSSVSGSAIIDAFVGTTGVVDSTGTATTTATGGSSATLTASITTTIANDLLIGYFAGVSVSSTPGAGTGFTQSTTSASSNGFNDGEYANTQTAAIGATSITFNASAGTAAGSLIALALVAAVDTTPPTYLNANVNTAGTALTVNWTETGSPPVTGTTGLTLNASGGAVTLSAVSTTGLVTTATTSRTIRSGETTTLSYTPGNFADSAATPNTVVAFTTQTVTNNSTSANDTTPPVIASLSIPAAGTSLTINWTEAGSPPVLQVGTFGSTQGLSITGLSGGAVTVLSATTSGLVTTATLSRTVISGETGGLLSITAGAFTDSFTPTPNATATVTNSAITNNSTSIAPPGAPNIGTVTAGSNQVTVNWTAGTGTTTSFNIQRSLSVGSGFSNLPAGTGVTGTSFVDTTAVNGTTYYYKVVGVNSGGTSVASAASAAATPITVIAGPTSLTAVYTAGVGIVLNWTNPGGNAYTQIDIYRLKGSAQNGVFERLDPTPFLYFPANTTTFTDLSVGTGMANVTNNSQFSYYIVGLVNNVESSPSNISTPVVFAG